MASQESDKQRAIAKIKSSRTRYVNRVAKQVHSTEERASVIKSARTYALNEIRDLAKAAIEAVEQNNNVFFEPETMSDTHSLSEMVNKVVADACRAFNAHIDNYFG